MVYALIGLVMPPLLTYFFTVLGWQLPLLIPVGGSIALAVLLFFGPDMDVRTDARKARIEFSRALTAYIDLVALERIGGSGPRQAMEQAAEVGDSWVFQRIGEELARSRWSGVAPWDALHALADELGLPDLDDLADIMRLSQEGAQVYSNLRARSTALRAAMLNQELRRGQRHERADEHADVAARRGLHGASSITPALLRVMTGS